MAEIQHRNIPSSGCHEPKHISTSDTSDSGKVITPSGSTAGASELRRLTASDIDGLSDSGSSYGSLTAQSGTTKSLPIAGDEPVELNSLFTLSPESEGVTSTNNALQFDSSGTYLVMMFLTSGGASGESFDLSYTITGVNQGTVLTGAPTDGNVYTTFLFTVGSNDTFQLQGVSSSASTVSVSFSNSITILKVS